MEGRRRGRRPEWPPLRFVGVSSSVRDPCPEPRANVPRPLAARQVWVDTRRERGGAMEEQVPETQGVSQELLASIDLGAEIEGMAGYQLRMRKFTFEPGAAFGPLHDH